MKLNFTFPVHFFPKHSVNSCTHHIFHVADGNENVVVDIPVPSTPKKWRVTNEGYVMKMAIMHHGKEIAGYPFVSEPASDKSGDSQHHGAAEDEDEKSTETWSEMESDNAEGSIVQELATHC